MNRMTTRARGQRGMTLVELMVALVLGLLLIGGFVNIFISSRQAFRTNEALGRMQENGRVGSEILLREIRAAGGNACGTKQIANTLNSPTSNWWSDWAAGPVRGYEGTGTHAGVPEGTGVAQRLTGTDVLVLLSATAIEDLYVTDHQPSSAQFKVNRDNHGLFPGDVLMVCDNQTAALFQATNTNQANGTIVHNTGAGTPGNCSKGLGYPTDCGSTNGNSKTFADGIISKVTGSVWYIGNNGRGTQSLYRSSVMSVSGSATTVASEVVEGVDDMQLEFLTINKTSRVPATSWTTPALITDWSEGATDLVAAVKVTLRLRSNEAVSANGTRLERKLIHVIRLRNREV